MSTDNLIVSPEELFSVIVEILEAGEPAEFTVKGMSMWPFLCSGRDRVIVEKCDSADLKIGDIVLLKTPLGNYMLHRITGLREDTFETTGDGNCFRDGWFSKDCLVARVTGYSRKGKLVTANSRKWCAMAFVWSKMFPIRRFLLKFLLKLSALKNKMRLF